ncbi:MAG: CcmD family protein [Balneolaceae bacterium]
MTNRIIQEPADTTVDTLTNSYSDSWQALEGIEQSSAFIQMMASNDLIFVVLGVSLIIWFILLFFIIKVDRNISEIEKSLEEKHS